jgi:hypothetical protein
VCRRYLSKASAPAPDILLCTVVPVATKRLHLPRPKMNYTPTVADPESFHWVGIQYKNSALQYATVLTTVLRYLGRRESGVVLGLPGTWLGPPLHADKEPVQLVLGNFTTLPSWSPSELHQTRPKLYYFFPRGKKYNCGFDLSLYKTVLILVIMYILKKYYDKSNNNGLLSLICIK